MWHSTIKRSTRLAIAVLGCLSTLACQVVIADQECTETAAREVNLDAAGAVHLVVEAKAGSLEVRGAEGTNQVRVTGEACASSTGLLEEIELLGERRDDTVLVTAKIPKTRGGSAARLDMVLEVPAGLTVEIDDGSGSIEVRGVAGLEIEDGSGSIDVADIAGDVRIDDGSGSVKVVGVSGSVWVLDGSGSIQITGIGGEVEVEDGSGGIDIADVDGGVVIVEDGSGGMQIERIGRDVVVRDDGSGSIAVRTVGGDFIVRHDGSGGIDYEDVEGDVSTP